MVQTLYFAGGCLWGVQAYVKTLKGVIHTEGERANGTSNTLEGEYVAKLENTLFDIIQTFGLEHTIPHCVLAHIDIQAEVEKQILEQLNRF